MKALWISILVAAGLGAAYVAVKSDAPRYAAPVVEPTPVVPTRLPRPAGPGEEVRVFEVTGMCCAGCTDKLYRALSAVEGVHAACVDFDTGTASALYESDRDPSTLVQALTFDKYTASVAQ